MYNRKLSWAALEYICYYTKQTILICNDNTAHVIKHAVISWADCLNVLALEPWHLQQFPCPLAICNMVISGLWTSCDSDSGETKYGILNMGWTTHVPMATVDAHRRDNELSHILTGTEARVSHQPERHRDSHERSRYVLGHFHHVIRVPETLWFAIYSARNPAEDHCKNKKPSVLSVVQEEDDVARAGEADKDTQEGAAVPVRVGQRAPAPALRQLQGQTHVWLLQAAQETDAPPHLGEFG